MCSWQIHFTSKSTSIPSWLGGFTKTGNSPLTRFPSSGASAYERLRSLGAEELLILEATILQDPRADPFFSLSNLASHLVKLEMSYKVWPWLRLSK